MVPGVGKWYDSVESVVAAHELKYDELAAGQGLGNLSPCFLFEPEAGHDHTYRNDPGSLLAELSSGYRHDLFLLVELKLGRGKHLMNQATHLFVHGRCVGGESDDSPAVFRHHIVLEGLEGIADIEGAEGVKDAAHSLLGIGGGKSIDNGSRNRRARNGVVRRPVGRE